MRVILGILAAILFLGYALYSWKILREQTSAMEKELIETLEAWLLKRGASAQLNLWLLLGVSGLLVIIYFTLVFTLLNNPFMQVVSAAFVGVELYHFIVTAQRFHRVFHGLMPMMQLLNWKVEHLSALIYSVHTLMVLVCLIFSL